MGDDVDEHKATPRIEEIGWVCMHLYFSRREMVSWHCQPLLIKEILKELTGLFMDYEIMFLHKIRVTHTYKISDLGL